MPRATALAIAILLPAIGLGGATFAQTTITNTTGSVGCAAVVQAAANGMNARIAADDTDIKPPQSVTQMTCLGNFFNGVGLNLVTNLLDPATLLQAVEGQICGLVQSTWSSLLGSAQCGLSVTGFNMNFGGLGGGLSCPKLSFGGGGPPIASVGIGTTTNSSGLYISGNGLPPTGYTPSTIPPGAL
jgi:hypothetical protein